MRTIGFSTGALAYSDFRRGLQMIQTAGLAAVELSALREPELDPLVESLDSLDLGSFSHVAVHAPGAIAAGNEQRVVDRLRCVAERGWNIIVHPDAIHEPTTWKSLGRWLCIENMDKRKPTGRDSHELGEWFERFPEAGFCLDLGHARQCDPTMTETYFLIKHFGDRLRQLHVSDVTSRSNHDRLSRACILSFQQVAKGIPESVPVILESVIATADDIADEVARARTALTAPVSIRPASRTALGTAP
jgi:hypothetical protein